MSDLAVVCPSSVSGAMYANVPTIVEAWVPPASSPATPKSPSFAPPSGITKMFGGFTSRCSTPTACAAARASATSCPM